MLVKSGVYPITNILTEFNSGFNAHTNPLFKELNILKLEDHTTLLNCLFVHDYFNKRLPKF